MIVKSRGRLFFFADDGRTGQELWTSDGTRKGTKLVKDINRSGGGNSGGLLVDVDGTLFFGAYQPSTGYELWKSDGTKSGTTLVRDIYPGRDSSKPREITNVNGSAYFRAMHPKYGEELWRSDGTRAGTVLIKDINGPGSSLPEELLKVGKTLYFVANDGQTGSELWKTDGTAKGTVLVKDIAPGPSHPDTDSNPNGLTKMDGDVFFGAWHPTFGPELWKSDGTEAGTVMVREINPGPSPPNCEPQTGMGCYGGPGVLTNVNGTLFFSAYTDTAGRELWKSDGTAEGTTMVKNIASGASGSPPGAIGSDPSWLTNLGGTLYFAAYDGTAGRELWRSRGTARNTELVSDILRGPGGSSPGDLTKLGGRVFFVAGDGRHGRELFRFGFRRAR